MSEDKLIHVRPTRPDERFGPTDSYIAWFDGDAAGCMAETPERAITALRTDPNYQRKQPTRCECWRPALGPGDLYGTVKRGAVDGIGREHASVYKICEKCNGLREVCQIHLLPRAKETELETENKRLRALCEQYGAGI